MVFLVGKCFLLTLYIVVFWKTVARFYHKSVVPSWWFDALAYHLIHRWKGRVVLLEWVGMAIMLVCVVLPTGAVGFSVAPFLWLCFKRVAFLKKKEDERRENVQRGLMEEAERRRVERLAENNRRAEARKQWLSENKPKLYLNTIDGVTAVLMPQDYEAVVKQTAINHRNGFWDKENVLYPAPNTIVFVTKQGQETLRRSIGRDARCNTAGLLSQLDEIVEAGNVELVRDENIFVPWVNETLIPFAEQRAVILQCYLRGTFEGLVEAQAPADLQPLS